MRVTVRAAMGAAVAAVVLSVGVVPAHAATRDGRCDEGEFCLYYNSDQKGSVSDFALSVNDYGAKPTSCYVFKGPGAGREECVKNNAASVWNRTGEPVTVFFNSGFGGATQVVARGVKANLSTNLKNQNASHSIGTVWRTPRANPYPAENVKAPKATRRTQFVDDEISRIAGEQNCWVGGYREYSTVTDHNTGNALDCVVPDRIGTYPTAAQRAYGWKLAEWLKVNASRLKVSYVIWDNKIWSVRRSSEGWRPYGKAASEVTAGHYDHVHVSMVTPS